MYVQFIGTNRIEVAITIFILFVSFRLSPSFGTMSLAGAHQANDIVLYKKP